jgi:hypothetical protein
MGGVWRTASEGRAPVGTEGGNCCPGTDSVAVGGRVLGREEGAESGNGTLAGVGFRLSELARTGPCGGSSRGIMTGDGLRVLCTSRAFSARGASAFRGVERDRSFANGGVGTARSGGASAAGIGGASCCVPVWCCTAARVGGALCAADDSRLIGGREEARRSPPLLCLLSRRGRTDVAEPCACAAASI